MGTSHGKKDEITLKLCSFNQTQLDFSLFWWVWCTEGLKTVAFQEQKGPTVPLLLGRKAKPPSTQSLLRE